MAGLGRFDVIFDAGQEFLRQLPAAPRARRNLCDDAAYAEPLFLEWRTIDCRNIQ